MDESNKTPEENSVPGKNKAEKLFYSYNSMRTQFASETTSWQDCDSSSERIITNSTNDPKELYQRRAPRAKD
jgi:hypothetical protein